MKPTKEIRTKYNTDYADKTDFAANVRLLQSIWHTEQWIEEFENRYLRFDKIEAAGR